MSSTSNAGWPDPRCTGPFSPAQDCPVHRYAMPTGHITAPAPVIDEAVDGLPMDNALPMGVCVALLITICFFLGGCAGWILHGVFA